MEGCYKRERTERGFCLRIDSSYVGMESARSYTSVTTQATSFSASAMMIQADATEGGDESSGSFLGNTQTKEGDVWSAYYGLSRYNGFVKKINQTEKAQEERSLETIRNQCMNYLIKWLYDSLYSRRGRKYNPQSDINQNMTQMSNYSAGVILGEARPISYSTYTLRASNQVYHKEEEQTSFRTEGVVRTQDGREIKFNLDLTMSREFEQYYEEHYEQTVLEMTDPLVINLDGNITELSDQKFEFDIDHDGVMDTISQLGSGSGYLALDKNDDGVINDGSELFGTKSGNGFWDLAEYDEDGNGWIDENDEIWDKLLIWTKDEDGKDILYHLRDKGVGAICLKQVQTNFALNSLEDNQTKGQICQTGIFLYENGNVGTMQNIDVAS